MTEPAGAMTADAEKERWGRQEVQVGLLLVAILVTSVAVLLVSLFFPATGEGGWLTFATVQPHREFIWWFLTLTGVNVVVTVVPVSLASVLLTPARGWRWVTAGAAIAIVGAAFYAVGVGGWAMVYFFAIDSSALDPATANAFIESVNDDLRLFGAAGGGALTVALGALLVAIGLWRSGNVPKWLPILMAVGTGIALIVPIEGVVGAFVEAPSAISSVMIGWYAWLRRGRQRVGRAIDAP